MKSRGGIKVSDSTEHFEPGDYVVGGYNELGRKVDEGKAVGSPEIVNEMASMIAQHASRHEGVALSKQVVVQPEEKKGKRGRKKKVEVMQVQKPVVAQLVKEKPVGERQLFVSFRNAFGQIKQVVEDVLEDDDSSAYMLIYASPEALSFIPKAGEHLELIIGGNVTRVFFPGTIFNWIDHKRRVMILYKEQG